MTSIPDVQSLLFGGGPFMYLVAALALVGVFVAVVLALLTSLGRWTPAATWLAMPSAVLATGALRIRYDHVLAEMATGLGASVERKQAPFEPEAGAYSGGGHGHSHDH